MGTPLVDHNTDELMTVEAFAQKYRVDASVVRSWAKHGYINYELVGPRKLRRIRPDSVITPIQPSQPIRPPGAAQRYNKHTALVNVFIKRDGMDIDTATGVVDSMDAADIDQMLLEANSGN